MALVKTGKRLFATALVLMACVVVPAVLAQESHANVVCKDRLNVTTWGVTWPMYNSNCVYAEHGYELAAWYVWTGAADVPGLIHVTLTDNGYGMKSGPLYTNPAGNPGTLYSGNCYAGGACWLYHPYWGTYCSRVWVNEGFHGYKQVVPETCRWTNGYY